MNTLFDIAPATETVEVNGKAVAVHGIALNTVLDIIARYPDLSTILGGGEVNPGVIMKFGGDAVASIIAAGCQLSGEKAEKKAAELPIEVQLDFVAAIIKATMPRGVGPFVAKLNAVRDSLYVKVETKLNGSGSAKATPAPLSSSSRPATRSATSGA